ncbi:MAG: type II toxin-antitoxin system HicA family toxin [Nitrospirae bacterium]|nr:type II toxin-antitoxin system HicA family toxin [Nitrospirota bacterium]
MTPHFPAVTSDEVVKVLRKIGFELLRQSGTSHAIFKRASDKKRVNVPVHSGKIIKRRTLKSIMDCAGITVEEFDELRRR